jgi:hypothetical protein
MVRESRRTEFRTQISQDVAAGVASNVDDFMVRVDLVPHFISLDLIDLDARRRSKRGK